MFERAVVLMCSGLLLACAGPGAPPSSAPGFATATAILRDADGAPRGTVALSDVIGGVDVVLDASAMMPGAYAFHIHAIGRCTPPDFASAGPHFNPTGALHGGHRGDLPNLVVDASGTGRVSATMAEVTLAGLLDGDGAAAVVHAKPDDGVTDPTGNAGPRLACGEIVPK